MTKHTDLKLNSYSVLQDPIMAEGDVAGTPIVALVDARRVGDLEVLLLQKPVFVVPGPAAVL
jgi:hypothetical protein